MEGGGRGEEGGEGGVVHDCAAGVGYSCCGTGSEETRACA